MRDLPDPNKSADNLIDEMLSWQSERINGKDSTFVTDSVELAHEELFVRKCQLAFSDIVRKMDLLSKVSELNSTNYELKKYIKEIESGYGNLKDTVNSQNVRIEKLEKECAELRSTQVSITNEDYDDSKIFDELTNRCACLENELLKANKRIIRYSDFIPSDVRDEDAKELNSITELSEADKIEFIREASITIITGIKIPRITEELGIDQRVVQKTANIGVILPEDCQSEYIGAYTRKISHHSVAKARAIASRHNAKFFMLNNTNFSIIVNDLFDLITK